MGVRYTASTPAGMAVEDLVGRAPAGTITASAPGLAHQVGGALLERWDRLEHVAVEHDGELPERDHPVEVGEGPTHVVRLVHVGQVVDAAGAVAAAGCPARRRRSPRPRSPAWADAGPGEQVRADRAQRHHHADRRIPRARAGAPCRRRRRCRRRAPAGAARPRRAGRSRALHSGTPRPAAGTVGCRDRVRWRHAPGCPGPPVAAPGSRRARHSRRGPCPYRCS